jgi:hypothetical protein
VLRRYALPLLISFRALFARRARRGRILIIATWGIAGAARTILTAGAVWAMHGCSAGTTFATGAAHLRAASATHTGSAWASGSAFTSHSRTSLSVLAQGTRRKILVRRQFSVAVPVESLQRLRGHGDFPSVYDPVAIEIERGDDGQVRTALTVHARPTLWAALVAPPAVQSRTTWTAVFAPDAGTIGHWRATFAGTVLWRRRTFAGERRAALVLSRYSPRRHAECQCEDDC